MTKIFPIFRLLFNFLPVKIKSVIEFTLLAFSHPPIRLRISESESSAWLSFIIRIFKSNPIRVVFKD